jgi:hypothetical protein
MSEVNWQAYTNPHLMLRSWDGSGKVSERKLRLFTCAYCHCIPELLAEEHLACAVEMAERLADGLLGIDELLAAQNPPSGWSLDPFAPLRRRRLVEARDLLLSITLDAQDVSTIIGAFTDTYCRPESVASQLRAQAHLFHDIFGRSLRPLPRPSPAILHWNGDLVMRLAGALYSDRRLPEGTLDPVRLAILADALEEAGADAELVAHLRTPGPHVRGCWAVDLLLRKE